MPIHPGETMGSELRQGKKRWRQEGASSAWTKEQEESGDNPQVPELGGRVNGGLHLTWGDTSERAGVGVAGGHCSWIQGCACGQLTEDAFS